MPSLNLPDVRSTRYLAVLALVAAAILVVGGLLRPRNEAPAVASDTDLARIARLAQRRSIQNTTTYFAAVAADTEPSLLRLNTLSTTGIVWDHSRILTASVAGLFPNAASVAAPGGDVNMAVAERQPNLPIVMLTVPPAVAPVLTPVRRSTAAIQSGEWIFALWKSGASHSFVPGSIMDDVTLHCGERTARVIEPSFVLTATMAGGGLFDIDGNLSAVILPCGDRMAAFTLDSIDAMLNGADSLDRRLLSRFGLRADALSADEAAAFKVAEGIVVREVWTHYPADAAGLNPGDIIRAVNGTAMTGPLDLAAMLGSEPGAPVTLSIERRARTMELVVNGEAVAPSATEPDASAHGLVIDARQAPDGFRIDTVLPGSPAAVADIQPGDRLLRINGVEPRDADDARRLLGRAPVRPAFVEIARPGRRVGVFIS